MLVKFVKIGQQHCVCINEPGWLLRVTLNHFVYSTYPVYRFSYSHVPILLYVSQQKHNKINSWAINILKHN